MGLVANNLVLDRIIAGGKKGGGSGSRQPMTAQPQQE
jgi:hypothetical protein